MKKLFLIVFAVIATLAAYAQNSSEQNSASRSKTFSVQPGGSLMVNVEPGEIVIDSWPKNEVSVEAEGIDERHPERLSMNQSGNTVTVEYRDRRHSTDHLRFYFHLPLSFNVDVKTSGGSIRQKGTLTGTFTGSSNGGSIKIDHILGSITATTGGGSVNLQKIEGNADIKTGGGSIETGLVTGTLNATTGGGSISFSNTEGKTVASTGGGSIHIDRAKGFVESSTGGGSIALRDIQAGASVRTGGGSIDLEKVAGPIRAATGGGSVQCEMTSTGNGRSMLKSGGGEIELTIPEKLKCTIVATVHLSYGNHGWHQYKIHSDFKADTNNNDSDGDELHAVYSINGGGETIELETSNANIDIRSVHE